MNRIRLSGLMTMGFFAVILLLIPRYVPRPAFIPGFAPPPDMWPRTVSWVGLVLGLLVLVLNLLAPKASEGTVSTDASPNRTRAGAMRFALTVAALIAFFPLVRLLGFVPASALLMMACIALAGQRQNWAIALLLAVGLPLLLGFVFVQFLGTQFPKGLLSSLIGM